MNSKIIKEYKRREPFLDAFFRSRVIIYLKKKNILFSGERQHRMAVYANDFIGLHIYANGIYEREELEILLDLVSSCIDLKNSAAKVLDIGANIGNHALYFSKYFNKVLAFEPNPHTFQLLKFNSQFVSNVDVYNFGLGEKTEKLELFEDEKNYGGSSTLYQSGKILPVTIDVKRLDEADIDLSDIELVKIDVEGMEYEVLSGALDLIKSQSPIIAFEQHLSDFEPDESETRSIRLLRHHGYKICWIEADSSGNSPWILRKAKTIVALFFGKRTLQRLVVGDQIPKKMHRMLIAIPQKYSFILKNAD